MGFNLFHLLGLVQASTALFSLVTRVSFSITNKYFLNVGTVVRAQPHTATQILKQSAESA